ncbi:Arc family DNA-binding protein [Sphingomonas sp. NPDC019816]|uniref:Arc family DNA-binding protein n=1 Tax=Sphingomonas sp. NPDC019816 TaxID=3390679 RepID=UPI003CFE07CE
MAHFLVDRQWSMLDYVRAIQTGGDMAREDPMLRVRLPRDLKEFVQASARENHRSMNGEIIIALRERQKAASAHTA